MQCDIQNTLDLVLQCQGSHVLELIVVATPGLPLLSSRQHGCNIQLQSSRHSSHSNHLLFGRASSGRKLRWDAQLCHTLVPHRIAVALHGWRRRICSESALLPLHCFPATCRLLTSMVRFQKRHMCFIKHCARPLETAKDKS
jgi:hypothetical protein